MKLFNSILVFINVFIGRFKIHDYIKFSSVYSVPSHYVLDKQLLVLNNLKVEYEQELIFRGIDFDIIKFDDEYSLEFVELITNRCDEVWIMMHPKYLSTSNVVHNYLHLKLIEVAYITNFTDRKYAKPDNPKPLSIIKEYPK